MRRDSTAMWPTHGRRGSSWILIALVLCDVGQAQNDSGSELVGFTYAEGYSSRVPDEPLDLGFRAFTLNSRPCEGLPTTDRVTAQPSTVELRVGKRYFLPTIVLRVYDGAGQFVPRAPLVAHLMYPRGVFEFESDNDRNFWLIARSQGSGVATFDIGCAEPTIRVEVAIKVVGDE